MTPAVKNPAHVARGRSNRRRGATFERQVRSHFIANGWEAGNTRGSHGVYDGFAMKAGFDPVLWQAKLSGSMPPLERAQIIEAAGRGGATPLIVDRPTRGRIRCRRVMTDGYDEWSCS